jgi:DNA-directed RNA polymerase II subunit RPB1
VLGIEAARQSLLNEILFVMESNGIYVNSRHLKILVDIMTTNGYLLAIDRHGMKKSDQSPFARASFEESADQLAKAAVFSEMDDMTGVSSNIIMGQSSPFGTHFLTDILLDLAALCPESRSPTFAPRSPMHSPPPSPPRSPTMSPPMSPVTFSVSPRFEPRSPSFTPSSPSYQFGSLSLGPSSPYQSPRYQPRSPCYQPMSPCYRPNSPSYQYDD